MSDLAHLKWSCSILQLSIFPARLIPIPLGNQRNLERVNCASLSWKKQFLLSFLNYFLFPWLLSKLPLVPPLHPLCENLIFLSLNLPELAFRFSLIPLRVSPSLVCLSIDFDSCLTKDFSVKMYSTFLILNFFATFSLVKIFIFKNSFDFYNF